MGTLFLVLTAVLFSASYVNQNKMMTLQNAQSSNVIPFLFGIMWSLLTACGWLDYHHHSGRLDFHSYGYTVCGYRRHNCRRLQPLLCNVALPRTAVTVISNTGAWTYCSGCTGRYFSWTASYRNSVCRTWTYNRCYDYR